MKVTIEVADDEVLVALKRVEGYEDVHPELVAEDAIGERWPVYRTIHGDGLVPSTARYGRRPDRGQSGHPIEPEMG